MNKMFPILSSLISLIAVGISLINAYILTKKNKERKDVQSSHTLNGEDSERTNEVSYIVLPEHSGIIPINKKETRNYLYKNGQLYYCLNPEVKSIVTCGRSPDADIFIGENNYLVSKKHFVIYYQEGKWHIKDNSSSNGTKLNGIQLKQDTPLHSGDLITIGNIILKATNNVSTDDN